MGIPASSLETFLRGMETENRYGVEIIRIPPLKPSLEGWKHVRVFDEALRVDTLKPSLEGWKQKKRL